MPRRRTVHVDEQHTTKTFYAEPGTRIVYAGENAEEDVIEFDATGAVTVNVDDQARLAQLERHTANPPSPVSREAPKALPAESDGEPAPEEEE